MTAKTLNGTQVWVTFCDDCGCNIGGFFCQVYLSHNLEEEIDNFVIHVEDIATETDPLAAACCLARQYIELLSDY